MFDKIVDIISKFWCILVFSLPIILFIYILLHPGEIFHEIISYDYGKSFHGWIRNAYKYGFVLLFVGWLIHTYTSKMSGCASVILIAVISAVYMGIGYLLFT